MELPCEVTTSDNPDVLSTGCNSHFVVNVAHIPFHEPEVRTFDDRVRATGEYPDRLCIWPRRSRFGDDFFCIANHPLVGGRSHCQRADLSNELRITGVAQVAKWKEPIQRVILGGDEPIKTCGCEVLGLHCCVLL